MALHGSLLLRLYGRQLATLVLDLQNNYATMLSSSFCGNVEKGVCQLVATFRKGFEYLGQVVWNT